MSAEIARCAAFEALCGKDEAVLVAVSGGPDSLALLLLAKVWADRTSRRLFVASVDHGLRPEARAEALHALDIAARLGAPARLLLWEGEKPTTGLMAAARAARYRLLAEEARRCGATTILTAHHAQDQAETLLMALARGEKSAQPGWIGLAPIPWAGPVPVWPEGAGLRVARPLLDVDKAQLQAALIARRVSWRDDPSNSNRVYKRARARALLATEPTLARRLARLAAAVAELFAGLDSDVGRLAATALEWRLAAGGLALDRAAFAAADPLAQARLLAAVAQVLGEAQAPPRWGKARAAAAKAASTSQTAFTLGDLWGRPLRGGALWLTPRPLPMGAPAPALPDLPRARRRLLALCATQWTKPSARADMDRSDHSVG